MKTRLFIKMVNGKRSTVNGFISVLRLQFTVLLIALAMTGCKKDDDQAAPHVYEDENAPPNAASKKAWVFGEQTWSDAIQCPECSKGTFENSYTEPQCRSYTDAERGKTYYYYNWPYVAAKKADMCPSPWRVPTMHDLVALGAYMAAIGLDAHFSQISAWCYTGYADGDSLHYVRERGYNWSAEKSDYLYYHSRGLGAGNSAYSFVGMPVRCVK